MAGEQDREEAKYTETQLQTLVTAGVEREVSALTQANEELQSQVTTLTTEQAELEARVATVEAERDAERAAKEAAEQAFADFKAQQEADAEKARLRDERVKAFKEAAGSLHGEEYYTEERAAQWAELSEDHFSQILETISTAAEAAGKKGDEDQGADGKEKAAAVKPETAAFGGGQHPSTQKGGEGASTTRRFFAAGGRLPANV